VSKEEVIRTLKRISRQLSKIQEMLRTRESTKTDYSIVTIFVGFIPIFLFMLSYFQAYSTEYFITFAFLGFFVGVSFIWAMIQVAKMESPFTYSLTLFLPLFIIFLPLLWSILVTFHVISTSTTFQNLSIATISIYATFFFAYFVIEFLYRKLIVRTES
jgi:hypothetical protein